LEERSLYKRTPVLPNFLPTTTTTAAAVASVPFAAAAVAEEDSGEFPAPPQPVVP